MCTTTITQNTYTHRDLKMNTVHLLIIFLLYILLQYKKNLTFYLIFFVSTLQLHFSANDLVLRTWTEA